MEKQWNLFYHRNRVGFSTLNSRGSLVVKVVTGRRFVGTYNNIHRAAGIHLDLSDIRAYDVTGKFMIAANTVLDRMWSFMHDKNPHYGEFYQGYELAERYDVRRAVRATAISTRYKD